MVACIHPRTLANGGGRTWEFRLHLLQASAWQTMNYVKHISLAWYQREEGWVELWLGPSGRRVLSLFCRQLSLMESMAGNAEREASCGRLDMALYAKAFFMIPCGQYQ